MTHRLITTNQALDRDKCITLANDMLTDVFTLTKYYEATHTSKNDTHNNIAVDYTLVIANKIADIRYLLTLLEEILKD